MKRYRNIRKGRTVAILANGPSLANYDFGRLGMDTLGMNASFMAHWASWHVVVERDQFDQFPGVYREMGRQGTLFAIGAWPVGHRLKPFPEALRGEVPFSFDLELGVVEGIHPIGSVAYAALQLAVWMGYATIYFLGLDLGPVGGEGHFHGKALADPLMEHQNQLFHVASDELHGTPHVVLVVGESRCTAFPRASVAEEARFPRKGAR
jgi:hypothetical protein